MLYLKFKCANPEILTKPEFNLNSDFRPSNDAHLPLTQRLANKIGTNFLCDSAIYRSSITLSRGK
jgi:hypothetical protein